MPDTTFSFRYVFNSTGEINGASFLQQTQDAINALGVLAQSWGGNTTEALRLANQAINTSTTASNNAQNALTLAQGLQPRVVTLESTVQSL